MSIRVRNCFADRFKRNKKTTGDAKPHAHPKPTRSSGKPTPLQKPPTPKAFSSPSSKFQSGIFFQAVHQPASNTVESPHKKPPPPPNTPQTPNLRSLHYIHSFTTTTAFSLPPRNTYRNISFPFSFFLPFRPGSILSSLVRAKGIPPQTPGTGPLSREDQSLGLSVFPLAVLLRSRGFGFFCSPPGRRERRERAAVCVWILSLSLWC